MPSSGRTEPKRIAHLFGAGATQAEADYLGARPVNLLMRDNPTGDGLSTRILQRSGVNGRSFMVDRGVDVEKLISLLAASGAARHATLAQEMRQLYFDEVIRGLAEARVIATPQLAIALLEMHRKTQFQRNVEKLIGILTTNHDGLLQIAFQEVLGAVNLGFPFASSEFTPAMSSAVPPLLQLHGSFTWTFGVPIEIRRLRPSSRYHPDTVWLPPAILKESKTYPFNRIASVAYALLVDACDVLRVVGSSLAQNDWNVLSLVFNAQRHREAVGRSTFKIELIMPHQHGVDIQGDCSYLSELTPIGFLTEGRFEAYKEEPGTQDPGMNNVFAYWLKEKVTHHYRRREFGTGELKGAMATISGEA